MNKTLRLSFSLKNTYRVNGILYSLKQIPLLKRLLPQSLYRVTGLKIFANILSVFWEILSAFLGKLLYFAVMIYGAASLYDGLPEREVFLHLFLFLTLIGSFMNTGMFNPTKDKYYAMILLRMDARAYTLVNYGYLLVKTVIGFLPFTVLFGIDHGVPLWLCLMLPFSVIGMKLCAAAISLSRYALKGKGYNENKFSRYMMGAVVLLLAAAYAPPAFGLVLPSAVSTVLFAASIPLGLLSLRYLINFRDYRAVNQELLAGLTNQMDASAGTQIIKKANEDKIAADASISSRRKGFEYLNELFIKRHRKILWSSSKKLSYAAAVVSAGVLLLLFLKPEVRSPVNMMVRTALPYFVFLMYAVNRGTLFTQALFMNCDHSLLTYSFYKRPAFILRLFRIRLREIMKINAVPALVIGGGLALILFASGGTEDLLTYPVLIVSILFLSLFFSIHYLTLYYLLQPYNAGTEVRSGTYRIIMTVTYMVCFYCMQLRLPVLMFGLMTIVFCLIYGVVACFLIYRLAPKTFRIRT